MIVIIDNSNLYILFRTIKFVLCYLYACDLFGVELRSYVRQFPQLTHYQVVKGKCVKKMARCTVARIWHITIILRGSYYCGKLRAR